jgi:hypothetical protein
MIPLKVKLFDRHGPAWDPEHVALHVVSNLVDEQSNFFQRKAKMQSDDIKKAEQLMETDLKT